jgi:hypothetical protein
MYGLKAAPFREASFSAACKGVKGADHYGTAKSRALRQQPLSHLAKSPHPTRSMRYG